MKGLLFVALLGASLSLWGFVADKDKLWEPGQVLRIHLVDASEDEASLIEELTRSWFDYAFLKPEFVLGWPAEDELSHIRVQLDSYNNDAQARNYSALGADSLSLDSSQPTMILSAFRYVWVSEKRRRRLVLHEFGHALGLIHEHQNPAFPYNWRKEAMEKRCRRVLRRKSCIHNIFGKREGNLFYGEFDEFSIMNYEFLPEMTVESVHIKKHYDLSSRDIEAVRTIYPMSK